MYPQGQPIFGSTPPAGSTGPIVSGPSSPMSGGDIYIGGAKQKQKNKKLLTVICVLIAIIAVGAAILSISTAIKNSRRIGSALEAPFNAYANYIITGSSDSNKPISGTYSSTKSYQPEIVLFHTNDSESADKFFAEFQVKLDNFKTAYNENKDIIDSRLAELIDRNIVLSNFAINYYKSSRITTDGVAKKYASSGLDGAIKSITDNYASFASSNFPEGVQYGNVMTEYYKIMLTTLSSHLAPGCFREGISGVAKLCPNVSDDFSEEETQQLSAAEALKNGVESTAQKNIAALAENCYAITEYIAKYGGKK